MKNVSLLLVLAILCCFSCKNNNKNTVSVEPKLKEDPPSKLTEFCLDTLILDMWIDTTTNRIIIADDVINALIQPCDEEISSSMRTSINKEKMDLSAKNERILGQHLKKDGHSGLQKISVVNLVQKDKELRAFLSAQKIDTICYKIHRKLPVDKEKETIYEISHDVNKGLCVKESPKTTGTFDCYAIDEHEVNLESTSLELVSNSFERICYKLDDTSKIYLKIVAGKWCILGKKIECL